MDADERCRVLRRRLARREQLVHSRSCAKNEIHAVLHRRLQGKPPCSDLSGVKGRRWLAGLELPVEERESLDASIPRTRARRGHAKAIVATARKLAIMSWCMLTRGEGYAHQQPSQAGAPARTVGASATPERA